MYKSNIDQKSNIYIRHEKSFSEKEDLPEKDAAFVARVIDGEALTLLQKHAGYNMTELTLTELQKQILSKKDCGKNATGELTHGVALVNGKIEYQCRCENEKCPDFSKCKPFIPKRDLDYLGEDEPSDKPLSSLGIDDKTDIFREPDSDLTEDTDVFSDEEIEAMENLRSDDGEFERLSGDDSRVKIIEAELNMKIVVNAAPGAGKTYTASERILFAAKKGAKILAACRTDSAYEEIKARLIASKADLSGVTLGTFDILATKFLSDVGMTADELHEIPYTQRVELFNEKFEAARFADFDVLVIDELHYLTNERATAAVNILKASKGGYLLLADKERAALSYGSQSGCSVNCVDLYREIRAALSKDVKKYLLEGNRRQSENLEKMTEMLREALLAKSTKSGKTESSESASVSEICRKQLSELPKTSAVEDLKIDEKSGTAAILCRRSGDAEYVSWLLHKNKIPHTLIRENEQGISIGRYLADILWDHRESAIKREMFVKRYTARCENDPEHASAYFNALCEYIGGNKDVLDCAALADKILLGGEIPSAILNARNNMLTVSTIGKAQGSEFDKVYLLGGDVAENEGKALYFAETLPKSELGILSQSGRNTFRRNKNDRWIRTVRETYKAQAECVGFATGNADDVDEFSFVGGDIAEAVRRQAYISMNVKCGDEITLKLNGALYDIIHKNNVIGRMSASYSENLLDEFGGRRYLSDLPKTISQLFVTNVITFVSYKDSEDVPPEFRKKKFWLGVEISGFGTVER